MVCDPMLYRTFKDIFKYSSFSCSNLGCEARTVKPETESQQPLKHCGKCFEDFGFIVARYCSMDCQKKDWDKRHRIEHRTKTGKNRKCWYTGCSKKLEEIERRCSQCGFALFHKECEENELCRQSHEDHCAIFRNSARLCKTENFFRSPWKKEFERIGGGAQQGGFHIKVMKKMFDSRFEMWQGRCDMTGHFLQKLGVQAIEIESEEQWRRLTECVEICTLLENVEQAENRLDRQKAIELRDELGQQLEKSFPSSPQSEILNRDDEAVRIHKIQENIDKFKGLHTFINNILEGSNKPDMPEDQEHMRVFKCQISCILESLTQLTRPKRLLSTHDYRMFAIDYAVFKKVLEHPFFADIKKKAEELSLVDLPTILVGSH